MTKKGLLREMLGVSYLSTSSPWTAIVSTVGRVTLVVVPVPLVATFGDLDDCEGK